MKRIAGLALVLVFLAAGRIGASPIDLRPEVSRLAEKIARAAKDPVDGFQEIAVGEFSGPPNGQGSSGRGIAELLAQELAQRGLTVKRGSAVGVKGEYEASQNEETRQFTATISAVVKQGKNVLFIAEEPIEDQAKIAALLGVDLSHPPPTPGAIPIADEKAQGEALRKAMKKPGVEVRDGIVRTDSRSLYAVEILVASASKGEYAPRKASREKESGLAFVDIKEGEVYAVRLINDSALDAAVTLTIDGLSMFVFSQDRDEKTKRPKYSQVIVPSRKSVVIQGWHQTNRRSTEFLVTEFPKSAAAALQSTGSVGVITASFAAAWKADDGRPPDEPVPPKGIRKATAQGAPVDAEYREVDYQTGAIRATVNVRYDR